MREKVIAVLFVAVIGLAFSGWSGSRLEVPALRSDFPGEAAPASLPIVINANNQVMTIRCNGAAVTVNGNHNTLTLLGTCSSLAVRGNTNRITLEAQTAVTNSGNNNIITLPRQPTTATPAPTATPPQLTGTPSLPTQTPVIDTQAPAVRWVAPVLAGERYDLREGEQVLLEAEASDNVGVAMVRFLWWDAASLQYVTLGTVLQPPYRLPVSAGALNPEWNQVFVIASDLAQNSSEYPYIWLYKQVVREGQASHQIFLPLAGK